MSDTHNKLHYGNKQKHLKILELIMVFNHFLAVQARRKNLAAGGQKPEGGAKNQKGGGHIFEILYWMYAATTGPHVKWGAQISNGGAGTTASPSGDDPVAVT